MKTMGLGYMACVVTGVLLAAIGCGDDDPPANGDKGRTSNGGDGGGGDDSGAGAGNHGGSTNPDPVGGQAGSDPAPGGQGGEGGNAPTFAEIIPVSDGVHPEASDLRGLRFSSTGKIWASGHLGINANPSPVGEPDKQLVIARFNEDGTPDESFSDDGFLTLNFVTREEDDSVDPAVVVNDGNEESLGIVELGDGDIVVSANVRDVNGKGMDAVLARFTSEGAPVTSFGEEGVARLVFGWAPADDASWTGTGAPSDSSWGLELDTSGEEERLVVFGAGSAAIGEMTGSPAAQRTDNDRFVTRVLASTGAIDPDFNDAKAFSYNSGGTFADNGRRGIVEEDGSILAGGYTNFGAGLGNHVVAIRLKPDGTRDLGFGHGIVDKGVLRSNPLINDGGVAECYAIARQSSGRIVTTGYGSATAGGVASSFGYATTDGPDLVALGFSADGKNLDSTFSKAGMLVIQSEELAEDRSEERGRDLVALADDRLVFAGNFATDPALFVTAPNGAFDPSNGIGQLLRYDPLPVTVNPTSGNISTSHFFRVVVSPDGKRIAAATNQNADGVMLAVLKVGEE